MTIAETTAKKCMGLQEKSLMIRSIISYLSEETKKKNKELLKDNLFYEQIPFDADDMFLKLAFLPDDDVRKVFSKIIG